MTAIRIGAPVRPEPRLGSLGPILAPRDLTCNTKSSELVECWGGGDFFRLEVVGLTQELAESCAP
jgi:hypothetical protein